MRYDNCGCGGLKDKRAVMCRQCQMKLNHPRKGTGVTFRLSSGGYVVVMVDNIERLQHREVVEAALGRKLLRSEHVHHLNGNKIDNRLENLQVLTASAHRKEHMTSEVAKQMSKLAHAAKRRMKNAPDL